VIPEHIRGSTCATTTTIQNDVFGAGRKSEVDVFFNVLGAEFETDRDSSTDDSDAVSEFLKIFNGVKVAECWW